MTDTAESKAPTGGRIDLGASSTDSHSGSEPMPGKIPDECKCFPDRFHDVVHRYDLLERRYVSVRLLEQGRAAQLRGTRECGVSDQDHGD